MTTGYRFIGLTLAIGGLAACAATQVTSTKKDPAFKARDMRRVLVIAVVRKPENQRVLEDEFVIGLKNNGSDAIAAHTLVPEGQKIDDVAWKKIVTDNQFDTVIVSRLVDLSATEKNVDAQYMTASGGGYGYYNAGHHLVYQPGYTVREETAAVETRVFQAAGEKSVWSAYSKTNIEKGADPEPQIREFARHMTRQIYQ